MKCSVGTSKIFWVVLISQYFLIQNSQSAKILSAVFMSTKSHKIVYDPLLEALAGRGHEVTVLSPVLNKNNITNLRNILTVENENLMGKFTDLFDMKEKNVKLNPYQMTGFLEELCRSNFKLPQVIELLKEKFDLIIIQPNANECVLGYASKFNAPIMLIIPVAAPSALTAMLGNPLLPSFVPNMFTEFLERMSFTERLINFFTETWMGAAHKYYFLPKMEATYREALRESTLPGFDEIIKNNVSLILSNSHFSLNGRRPFLPDVVEVGGMHCRPAKPLPKELEDFANSSGTDGFIFFSMGSVLNGNKMPEKYRKTLLNAFAKMKQKVLWKWETEIMDDLPSNVKLIKWAPQQDILGHPNIRAFITHGGLGSTTEAVYHGVPLIGIPMFGDQTQNMNMAVAGGYAYLLEFLELSEDTISRAVNEVLGNPKYKENVQTLSRIFKDQPMNPLDRAVYWTEYVLRHKGATHLRSAARKLNFFQYHSLDVIGAIFAILAIIAYIVFVTTRYVFCKIYGFLKSNSNTHNTSARNRKAKKIN